jgi:hypothetical protein
MARISSEILACLGSEVWLSGLTQSKIGVGYQVSGASETGSPLDIWHLLKTGVLTPGTLKPSRGPVAQVVRAHA